jgi:lysine N6-hydroxylase
MEIYDLIGIGIGPFNLGLAALSSSIPDLNCLFMDQSDHFDWHPGLMIEGARLQVPFYADLVTLADPCSPFTYMNFLKQTGRMFRFAINEQYFPLRAEYNRYCQWVASKLNSLQFGLRCERIGYDRSQKVYEILSRETISGRRRIFFAKHLVIGVGTVPYTPDCAKAKVCKDLFHGSEYMKHKKELLKKSSVTIIGSGQSAAEIFQDLLSCRVELKEGLNWFTRSARIYPMDYSRFALEMTSPDYINYFFGLDAQVKSRVLKTQDQLYKAVNMDLIHDISETLYRLDIDGSNRSVQIRPNCELVNIEKDQNCFNLEFHHLETGRTFIQKSAGVILATGYKNFIPAFIEHIKELICFNESDYYSVNRNYSIDYNSSIFVQNADLYSHGFNSADLGMGPYRNATILNTILGREYFKMERNVAFQTFGIPIK